MHDIKAVIYRCMEARKKLSLNKPQSEGQSRGVALYVKVLFAKTPPKAAGRTAWIVSSRVSRAIYILSIHRYFFLF
jgi:hypothetical protein